MCPSVTFSPFALWNLRVSACKLFLTCRVVFGHKHVYLMGLFSYLVVNGVRSLSWKGLGFCFKPMAWLLWHFTGKTSVTFMHIIQEQIIGFLYSCWVNLLSKSSSDTICTTTGFYFTLKYRFFLFLKSFSLLSFLSSHCSFATEFLSQLCMCDHTKNPKWFRGWFSGQL